MKNPYIVCQTNVVGLHQLYIMIWLWSLITRPSKDLLQLVDRLGLEITVLNIHLKTNNCIYAFDNNNSPYEVNKEE